MKHFIGASSSKNHHDDLEQITKPTVDLISFNGKENGKEEEHSDNQKDEQDH